MKNKNLNKKIPKVKTYNAFTKIFIILLGIVLSILVGLVYFYLMYYDKGHEDTIKDWKQTILNVTLISILFTIIVINYSYNFKNSSNVSLIKAKNVSSDFNRSSLGAKVRAIKNSPFFTFLTRSIA